MRTIKTFPFIPTSIDTEQLTPNRAKISAYPFETGYGVTIAHPLKRLLMSSSVGYAVVGIKIDGVAHEFDSIRGMSEDVSLFIINLRKLQFKIKDSQETSVVVHYSFTGEKIILGSDLRNDKVDVVNAETYLATINDDIKIDFSLIISKGIGYVASEDIRGTILNGYIPVDAYFTPIKKVVYEIENVLVKDDPTFEKVVFDVETDGRISALEAFKYALSIMYKQMSVFNQELHIDDSLSGFEHEPSEDKILYQKVDTLNLSVRCYNCLEKMDLQYIGQLLLMGENELKSIKNLGEKSYKEIVAGLEKIGYPITTQLSESTREKLAKKFKS